MIEIKHEGTNHKVVYDDLKDLCYLTDRELNRRSNFYVSIEQFLWREFNTLYVAEPYKEGSKKNIMEGEAIGRELFGITPKFISPSRFVWAPNGGHMFVREIPIDIYEISLDEVTGYPLHHFGAMSQLVDPLEMTVTEVAHKFFVDDKQIYGKLGGRTFPVSFTKPTKQRGYRNSKIN